jgi:hypothetical protein
MPDTSGAVSLGQQPPAPEQEATAPRRTAGELVALAEELFPGLPASELDKFAEAIALREANEREEATLARQYSAGIPPQEAQRALTGIRVDTLLDALFPPGTPAGASFRLEVEMRYQRVLSGQWKMITQQVIQARLASGAQVDPAMLQKMMNQQIPPGLHKG